MLGAFQATGLSPKPNVDSGVSSDFVFTYAVGSNGETMNLPARDLNTYNATVDWGDGSSSAITTYNDADLAHVYATAGNYDIRISGDFPYLRFHIKPERFNVIAIAESTFQFDQLNFTFSQCNQLVTMPKIGTSGIDTYAYTWQNCSALENFAAEFFDSLPAVVSANCFYYTWKSCTSLTLTSVQNILVSIAASGTNAPAGVGTEITLDGVETYATVSADSTCAAAITTLKSREWAPVYKGTAL